MSNKLDVSTVSFEVTNAKEGVSLARDYPAGSTFNCVIEGVSFTYDRTNGGQKVTEHLRITGVRAPDGTVIPYPSKPSPPEALRKIIPCTVRSPHPAHLWAPETGPGAHRCPGVDSPDGEIFYPDPAGNVAAKRWDE